MEHTDKDNTQELKVNSIKQMLENARLFVTPVNNKTSILACIACQKGIKSSNALSHAKSKPHKLRISKQKQGKLKDWIQKAGKMLANKTMNLPKVLPQSEKPVEELQVLKGLSCTECTHCCITSRTGAVITRTMASLLQEIAKMRMCRPTLKAAQNTSQSIQHLWVSMLAASSIYMSHNIQKS